MRVMPASTEIGSLAGKVISTASSSRVSLANSAGRGCSWSASVVMACAHLMNSSPASWRTVVTLKAFASALASLALKPFSALTGASASSRKHLPVYS
jgi:hypothetical protein